MRNDFWWIFVLAFMMGALPLEMLNAFQRITIAVCAGLIIGAVMGRIASLEKTVERLEEELKSRDAHEIDGSVHTS